MSEALCATSPDALRARANRLRDVARGVINPKVTQEIENFICELEARADELSAIGAGLRHRPVHRSDPVQRASKVGLP